MRRRGGNSSGSSPSVLALRLNQRVTFPGLLKGLKDISHHVYLDQFQFQRGFVSRTRGHILEPVRAVGGVLIAKALWSENGV